MEIAKINGSNLDLSMSKLTTSQAQNASPRQSIHNAVQNTQQSSGDSQNDQLAKDKDLNQIAQNLNEQMKSLDTNIRFAYSDKIEGLYISVTEKDTGRVIRQIPSEEAMKMAEHFKNAIGLIFDKEG
ncbi:flagellar biosynthesis protein FlaG [Campylobacter sp. MIT 12-8780]|uniref:FlaG family protein n=1 Tax=unclassified Campylobacter TaxID=2593542 RepID=UPI0010F91731|nr:MULTISPECIES: FlaG family protein [unclassified Campylobacter]TKX28620.1 flagellar biosynthesis protein FlaG [Campylobacter sp. MIT 12-5580]TQR41981.1 flagellar biosynthesis protein FlaG [Campylobacter sp. MIT 12-8780]